MAKYYMADGGKSDSKEYMKKYSEKELGEIMTTSDTASSAYKDAKAESDRRMQEEKQAQTRSQYGSTPMKRKGGIIGGGDIQDYNHFD